MELGGDKNFEVKDRKSQTELNRPIVEICTWQTLLVRTCEEVRIVTEKFSATFYGTFISWKEFLLKYEGWSYF